MAQKTETSRVEDPDDDSFRLLADGSTGYALFLLAFDGRIAAWTPGATRLLGYRPDDILGESYARLFFRPEDVERGEPEVELRVAAAQGLVSGGQWYLRQDGTTVWGEGITFALRDEAGTLKGFARLVGDFTLHKLSPSSWSGLPAGALTRLSDALAPCRTHLLGLIDSPQERPAGREG